MLNKIGGQIDCETLEVAGIYPAIIGMRNPLDSRGRSNSEIDEWCNGGVHICKNDLDLGQRLTKAGSEHRKYLRQIQVWADITMPRYIWQELDTYKFGTKNSCSTMHTLYKNKITLDNFYFGNDPIVGTVMHFEDYVIPMLNELRELYFDNDLEYRWIVEMKRILPENFLQLRTWNTNYEELLNIYNQRKHHRLKDEYKHLLEWIELLPYFKELCLE